MSKNKLKITYIEILYVIGGISNKWGKAGFVQYCLMKW